MGEARNRMKWGLSPSEIRKDMPIQVDLKNATPKVCECGCKFFMPVVTVYTVSALVSPIGKELTAQQPVLVCMECKKVLVYK